MRNLLSIPRSIFTRSLYTGGAGLLGGALLESAFDGGDGGDGGGDGGDWGGDGGGDGGDFGGDGGGDW